MITVVIPMIIITVVAMAVVIIATASTVTRTPVSCLAEHRHNINSKRKHGFAPARLVASCAARTLPGRDVRIPQQIKNGGLSLSSGKTVYTYIRTYIQICIYAYEHVHIYI